MIWHRNKYPHDRITLASMAINPWPASHKPVRQRPVTEFSNGTTWTAFLRPQTEALLAYDFFETVTLTGTRVYAQTVIEHASPRPGCYRLPDSRTSDAGQPEPS
ncbi:hypothetical protein [Micromonospora sp. IBHARD004]|uniref:hypothetical protein n=1 Tax=Micromonospora sp. IBHARD004 TaxID=3457764 RepID=UPI00405931F1